MTRDTFKAKGTPLPQSSIVELKQSLIALADRINATRWGFPNTDTDDYLLDWESELRRRAADAQQTAAMDAVAWMTTPYGDMSHATAYRDQMQDWQLDGLVVTPLYTHPAPSGGVMVTDAMVQRAMEAYSNAAHAEGFSRPSSDGMDWHNRWMRAALEAALDLQPAPSEEKPRVPPATPVPYPECVVAVVKYAAALPQAWATDEQVREALALVSQQPAAQGVGDARLREAVTPLLAAFVSVPKMHNTSEGRWHAIYAQYEVAYAAIEAALASPRAEGGES